MAGAGYGYGQGKAGNLFIIPGVLRRIRSIKGYIPFLPQLLGSIFPCKALWQGHCAQCAPTVPFQPGGYSIGRLCFLDGYPGTSKVIPMPYPLCLIRHLISPGFRPFRPCRPIAGPGPVSNGIPGLCPFHGNSLRRPIIDSFHITGRNPRYLGKAEFRQQMLLNYLPAACAGRFLKGIA